MSIETEVLDEGVAETGSQPTIETTRIVLNGEEVEVQNVPEVIDKLKAAEHNLKSGYDRKLATERQAIEQKKQEVENKERWLQEDLEWLSTHTPDEFDAYLPKVHYGEEGGYTGKQSQARTRTVEKSTFEEDPKVKALEAQLAELKGEITKAKQYDDESGKNAVISTLEVATKEYGMADVEAVRAKLEQYYYAHGNRHAPANVVRDLVKQSHDHVAKFVPKTQQPQTGVFDKPRSATPAAGGVPPAAEKKNDDISFLDIDANLADYEAFKRERLGG